MTLVIMVALFIPGPDLPSVGVDHLDLLVHVSLFGAWGAAVQWERRPSWPISIALAVGFGVGSELLQKLAVQRTFSWLDIAADIVGVLLGTAIVKGWRSWRRPGDPRRGPVSAGRRTG